MQTYKVFQMDNEEEKQRESLCFPYGNQGYLLEIISIAAVMKDVEPTDPPRLSFSAIGL